jgi:hypothetical protein
MNRLERWDRKVLLLGNGVQWLSLAKYRKEKNGTQTKAIGAWGRKINILWLGVWKGSNV